MSVNDLKNNKLWWYRPEWLLQDSSKWPQWNTRVAEANSEFVSEERGNKHMIFEVSATHHDQNKIKVRKPFEIDEERYSSFKNLLRVTAYVNRFINYIKNKRKINNELTANKINRAEMIWIKYITGKLYLSNKRTLSEKQRQSQLNPKIHQDGNIK